METGENQDKKEIYCMKNWYRIAMDNLECIARQDGAIWYHEDSKLSNLEYNLKKNK